MPCLVVRSGGETLGRASARAAESRHRADVFRDMTIIGTGSRSRIPREDESGRGAPARGCATARPLAAVSTAVSSDDPCRPTDAGSTGSPESCFPGSRGGANPGPWRDLNPSTQCVPYQFTFHRRVLFRACLSRTPVEPVSRNTPPETRSRVEGAPPDDVRECSSSRGKVLATPTGIENRVSGRRGRSRWWIQGRDSNPGCEVQSLACFRYTTLEVGREFCWCPRQASNLRPSD